MSRQLTGKEPDFIFKDEAEARACCEYWMRQLRLGEWVVTLTIVRRINMFIAGAGAECRYHRESRSAILHILDAIDWYAAGEWFDRDQEVALVHELLHLKFANCEDSLEGTAKRDFEFSIDSTAQSLVLLNRGIQR